jgi:hypothetical protein
VHSAPASNNGRYASESGSKLRALAATPLAMAG